MIVVEPGDPFAPQAHALLEASQALMRSMFPAETNYYLSFEALAAEDVHFFIARRGAVTLGCGALAVRDGYGEVKSMFVSEDARGQGVADALLRQLEDKARELGLPMIRLETGPGLHAAHRLYARHGFKPCGPFGDYEESDFSIFMEKPL